MDSTLVSILVKDIALPELLRLLHSQMNSETDQTITITLSKDVNEIKQIGQAFLDATKSPTP